MTITLSFDHCPVIELRRYRLQAGRLHDLLATFERHLVEPQEDAGMIVGATFADEDDPDSFTWLRGFADHDARVRALEAFYGGPVWARHRDAANATMVDSDDVLLLRPTRPAHRPAAAVARGAAGADPRHERVLLGTHLVGDDGDSLEHWFATAAIPALEDVLGVRTAAWRTDPAPNGFPRLPVRDDRALAWLAVFPDAEARNDAAARVSSADIGRELERRTHRSRTFRLAPTARSAHPAAEPPRRRAADADTTPTDAG
ncbi:MAG TPA: NIPSNAP family protein [Flexivirga sp.]|uniref:NIPSNAP family protein n=1 Tax=Flexivirga sp. TaxID=1962927 RepID=UPI002C2BF33B|nr:NIPSNAP family protein [Flexivirga sp.]HWC24933.1 NIPSNAP family protein [Flexivirga sp.]